MNDALPGVDWDELKEETPSDQVKFRIWDSILLTMTVIDLQGNRVTVNFTRRKNNE